jgi:hypothetical protein
MSAAVTGEVAMVPGQPALASGIVDPNAPLAGERFPQAKLGDRWFDDVHGAGWRFVTDDPAAGDLDPALVDWLESIGGRVIRVEEHAPDLTAWLREHNVRWALQRPDFHLYGTAADRAAAADLLAHLRARVTDDAPTTDQSDVDIAAARERACNR